jgi:hypothetical protein
MKYVRPWLAALALGLATAGSAAAEAPLAADVSPAAGTPDRTASEAQAHDSCGPTTPYRKRWGHRRHRHHRRHHRGGWRDWGRDAKVPGLN